MHIELSLQSMRCVIILIAFFSYCPAQTPPVWDVLLGGANNSNLPSPGFKNCSGPSPTNCAPFQTMQSMNNITATNLISTFFGILKCEKRSKAELLGNLSFCIIENGQKMKMVNGTTFMSDPTKHMDVKNPCIWVIMGGIITDCDMDPNEIPNILDWRILCAIDIVKFLNCSVIVISWGAFSCHNYACNCAFNVPVIGKGIGEMFATYFIPSSLRFYTHSLGGQILAYACQVIKEKLNQIIQKFIACDYAGPLYKGQMASPLSLFFEIFENPMSKDLAVETIAVMVDPGKFGTASCNNTKTIIKVNAKYLFKQPSFGPNPMSNHVFGCILNRAFCAFVRCLANNNPNIIVNPVTDNLQNGIYDITINNCYPLCNCSIMEAA